ncbi:7603_t:CDS:2, partial [Cetraspora pellucida]
DRTRISILLACNTTGTEKIKPLVIGSSIEPRALSGINHAILPVTYCSNLKAWMKSDIYGDKGKRDRGRASVYALSDLSNYKPTNIQVKFLPALTTSHLQPMDARIIKCFKAKYQKKYIQHILDQFDRGLDIRDPNTYIPTEEILDDNQIVETVLADQLERQQGDPDDSDDEPPKISAYE